MSVFLLGVSTLRMCRRCRVGHNWWYRGEHCEEYVSEPLVVGIAIASVAVFLLVASGVIFFLARALRNQYEEEDIVRYSNDNPLPNRIPLVVLSVWLFMCSPPMSVWFPLRSGVSSHLPKTCGGLATLNHP